MKATAHWSDATKMRKNKMLIFTDFKHVPCYLTSLTFHLLNQENLKSTYLTNN